MAGPEVIADDVQYASIVDQTTSVGYTYICEAQPGTPTSSASWRICRLTTSTGQFVWAGGNANFDKVADNRSLMAYL